MDIGRVEIHVRELGVTQRPVSERGDPVIETGTDPRHFRFGDPGIDTERDDQVVNRTGGNAVDVGAITTAYMA